MRRALAILLLTGAVANAQVLTPPPARNSNYPCRNDGSDCSGIPSGTVTTSPVGSGAAGRFTLFAGANSVTSDAEATFTGSGNSFLARFPSARLTHLVGPAGAAETSPSGGGFTNQPGTGTGGTLDLVSSNAGDTAVQVTLIGENAGVDVYENVMLNGLVVVTSASTFEHLLAVTVSSGTALGNITISRTSDSATITTITLPDTSMGLYTFFPMLGNLRAFHVVADGATTKWIGIGGYDIGGVGTQRTPIQLSGTSAVTTATTWSAAVNLYIGDLEVTRTVTLFSDAGIDVTNPLIFLNGSGLANLYASNDAGIPAKYFLTTDALGGFRADVGFWDLAHANGFDSTGIYGTLNSAVQATTQAPGTNDTTVATTAFVLANAGSSAGTATSVTDNVATVFAKVTMSSGSTWGGRIVYKLEGKDATNFVGMTGAVDVFAIDKAGTITCTVGAAYESTSLGSGGATSVNNGFTCADATGNVLNILVNYTTSLADSAGWPKIIHHNYSVDTATYTPQ